MNTVQSLFSETGITDSTRMLHTPGDFAKKNLLYVQEVGKLKSLQPHKARRENLDSFLFMGVLEGEGSIEIKGRSYKLKEGDCAFINCADQYMHESSEEKPWRLMWVHFNGITAKAYYELFHEKNDQCCIFRPERLQEAERFIESLMEYQKGKDLESELESGSILVRLVNFCLMSVMRRESPEQEEEMKCCAGIREYVNENYKEQDLMGRLSEKYGQEEGELNAVFLRVYGIELQDYILNRRFTVAKELLRFTIKPIRDIVEESGIRNGDLFRQLFKEGEGMSAEEYRMKWAQWIK
ncbi:MAG: AraC family ligand binding domain-containing protein [Lachnospiraceae bacterium]|nr:AraC family ligand binding domain-containing protein [Lachnospiraceae bacterium]